MGELTSLSLRLGVERALLSIRLGEERSLLSLRFRSEHTLLPVVGAVRAAITAAKIAAPPETAMATMATVVSGFFIRA